MICKHEWITATDLAIPHRQVRARWQDKITAKDRQPEVTVSVIQYSKWNHQYQDFEITGGKMKDSARYADLASNPSNNYHCATLSSEETLGGKEVFWNLIQGRQNLTSVKPFKSTNAHHENIRHYHVNNESIKDKGTTPSLNQMFPRSRIISSKWHCREGI